MFRILLLILAVVSVSAQIPCDDVYGASCPEESGWKVGECIKEAGGYSTACADFIIMSDTCRGDIEEHCKDMAYTGDLVSCLTEWTPLTKLSDECQAVIPSKKAPEKKKNMTKEERAKANKRRRARQKAAQEARDMGL